MVPLNQDIEKELLQQVSEGDEHAFKRIFNAYRDSIYSFGLFFTHSEFLAEEITQEVFMNIWLNRKQLREISYFFPYLKTIARNIGVNHLKRVAYEKGALKTLMERGNRHDSITEHIHFNEYSRLLDQAIKQLPSHLQEVYILHQLEGVKQEVIAQKLNLSLHTVKDYMKHAHKAVRQFMDAYIHLSLLPLMLFFV